MAAFPSTESNGLGESGFCQSILSRRGRTAYSDRISKV